MIREGKTAFEPGKPEDLICVAMRLSAHDCACQRKREMGNRDRFTEHIKAKARTCLSSQREPTIIAQHEMLGRLQAKIQRPVGEL